MPKITKNFSISLSAKDGTFTTLLHKIKRTAQNKENSSTFMLRQLLSNEKARLLHVIKSKQPQSIYELAKLLGRDFKSVRQDIKILESFGFIELVSSNKNNRERLRPVVDADEIIITVTI
jgi:predicted transcriptional regulator